MQKILFRLFLMLSGLLVCFVNADSLIGVEGKYHGYEAKEPALGGNYKDNTVAFSAKVGAQGDEYRVSLMFDIVEDSEYGNANISQNIVSFNIDYFIPTGFKNVKPYIGLGIGYGSYEIGGVEEKGALYGGSAGIILPLIKKFDIDVFIRYLMSDIEQVDYYVQSGIGIQYRF